MNIYYSKILTTCNIMIAIQVLITLQILITNAHLTDFPKGTISFLLFVIAQNLININLLIKQKKVPTLKKGYFTLLIAFFTAFGSLYWFGFYAHTPFLGWALMIGAIVLIVNQKKYNQMG